MENALDSGTPDMVTLKMVHLHRDRRYKLSDQNVTSDRKHNRTG